MHFLIGDLQGCCDAFERLLADIGCSPSRDQLYLLGDLVNRGPQSLQTLERLIGLGDAARCLLGNHDLHLLAVAHGVRPQHRSDTLETILSSPRREALLDWLRTRPLAMQAQGWLMVHAGLVPQWDAALALRLAGELEVELAGPRIGDFLREMFGNEPSRWSPDLAGADRLRFAINVLTRIRFVQADGRLDLKTKEAAMRPPDGLYPWFDAPNRRSRGTPVAFGHWSTLGLTMREDLLSIDTGCVWGGALTAVRIDGGRRELHQNRSEHARRPG